MNEVNQNKIFNFDNIEMGIGTWSWGDSLYWGYDRAYHEADIKAAFDFCINEGIRFFDTAEVYGQGKSETLLGKFIGQSGSKVFVASKFMPYPWRLNKKSFRNALAKSLQRLELPKIDLYQIHMPLPPVNIETWMEAMAEAMQAGYINAIGVSNYDRNQIQRAYDDLLRQALTLTSNQVEYNLLNRSIEKNDVKRICDELGIKIIAYSPLAMGLLSGKYNSENMPSGFRSRKYSKKYVEKTQPLIKLLKKIGSDHAGKSPSQVAINWVMCKGAIPIPGVKNIKQAEENTAALRWKLSEEDVQSLDDQSAKIVEE